MAAVTGGGGVQRSARTAREEVTPRQSLGEAREAAMGCRACELWERGTQTVFGEGPAPAAVMLVGEQPGHEEDLTGHPFVGPAGRVLDRALEAAGIDRKTRLRHERGEALQLGAGRQWRIHAKPTAWQVRACRPWILAELSGAAPVLVCLGSTAAQALLGRNIRITESRGRAIPSPLAPYAIATLHPSAVLRAPDDAARAVAMQRLVDDLTTVARLVAADPKREHATKVGPG